MQSLHDQVNALVPDEMKVEIDIVGDTYVLTITITPNIDFGPQDIVIHSGQFMFVQDEDAAEKIVSGIKYFLLPVDLFAEIANKL